MAKDPAFLFYSNDFDADTKFMSDEQVGKYLRLLIAQHQHGHLTEKQVLFICKTYDVEIMQKFAQDSENKFFNQRLDKEIERRKGFSESRSNNRKGKKTEQVKKISKSYVNHMETETETETITETNNKKGIDFQNFSELFKEKWSEWKKYKKDQFNFTFKSGSTEQTSLNQLQTLSNGNEHTASKIIEQSIANGWKGFFAIKSESNDRDADRVEYWNNLVENFGTEEEKKTRRIERP
jgi:uncharacterized protein YdaU (DUF1376 family)